MANDGLIYDVIRNDVEVIGVREPGSVDFWVLFRNRSEDKEDEENYRVRLRRRLVGDGRARSFTVVDAEMQRGGGLYFPAKFSVEAASTVEAALAQFCAAGS